MTTPTVMTVVGARPQFIKAAVVSRAFAAANISEILVHTGQHFDHEMSEVFFQEMGIPRPYANLGVGSGSHAAQTSAVMVGIENLIAKLSPRALVVYGDTNSTLGAALAAAKQHVPVAHVEAGLRSFNRRMPEEVNRVLTDHVSSLLFTPSAVATEHLRREGISGASVIEVGDVMYDAVRYFRSHAPSDGSTRGHILATIHRAENTGDPIRLEAIFAALTELARDREVILPLHPRTRIAAAGVFDRPGSKVTIIPPVGYSEMMSLQARAAVIVTDSGGIQKEAYFHHVPCVTVRDETEWTELVAVGWNRLADPASSTAILASVEAALTGEGRSAWVELYGAGDAGQRIATEIAMVLNATAP